jgi:Papain family cysteine protease
MSSTSCSMASITKLMYPLLGRIVPILFSCIIGCLFSAVAADVQAQDRSTGALLIPPQLFDQLSKAPPVPGAPVGEPKISMRKFFPRPKDQGGPEACTAFAVGYELGTYFARTNYGWQDENEEHLLSPAFIYNQFAQGDPHKAIYIQTALDLAHGGGVCTWKTMPYDESRVDTQPEWKYRVEARHFIYPDWAPIAVKDHQWVRSYLASGKPIVIGALVDHLNYGEWQVDGNKVTHKYLHPESKAPHTLVVVGYNDEIGAFEIMNSWGPDWNDAGFGWIGYDFWPQWVQEGYVLNQQKITGVEKVPGVSAKKLTWLPVGPEGLKNGNWGFPSQVDVSKLHPTAEKKLPKTIASFFKPKL